MSSIRLASTASHITFVMGDVSDLDTLLAGLPTGSEVHVLDAGGDALAQMAALLADRTDIDALHLM